MIEENWKSSEVVSIFANKYLPQLEEEKIASAKEANRIVEEKDAIDNAMIGITNEANDLMLDSILAEVAKERQLHSVVTNLEKIASAAAVDGCEKAAYMIEQTIMVLQDKLEGN